MFKKVQYLPSNFPKDGDSFFSVLADLAQREDWWRWEVPPAWYLRPNVNSLFCVSEIMAFSWLCGTTPFGLVVSYLPWSVACIFSEEIQFIFSLAEEAFMMTALVIIPSENWGNFQLKNKINVELRLLENCWKCPYGSVFKLPPQFLFHFWLFFVLFIF